MKAFIEVSEFILAKPAWVFSFVSNLEHHPRWVTGLSYISSREVVTPELRYESVSVGVGGDMAGQHIVRQVVRDRVVEIESVTGPLESTIQYVLEPLRAGTNVKCNFVIHSDHPVFGLALPVIEMMARNRLETDLVNLKDLCERAHGS